MITKEALDTEKGDELFRQIEEHFRALPPSYDPAGKRDPFQSLIESFDEKEMVKIAPRQQICDSKRKREFLESFDLSSLDLVGIINSRNNLALIETPNGKGYILKKGMYIGKNCGKAVNITSDRVVVREQIKDLIKGFRVVTTEVKLKRKEE
jgi:type IV pilus assembly protein PilP